MFKLEDIQNYGKDQFETTVAHASNLQNGLSAIASAYGDYGKKSYEDTKSFVEKLSGVKSLDKAFQAHTDYARTTYDTFVAEAQKIGPLWRSRPAGGQAAGKRRCKVCADHQLSPRLFFCKQKARLNQPGFFACFRVIRVYRATRSWLSDVPIELNAVRIWLELVSMKNLSGLLAQYCSTAEVGSAGVCVFTWTV